MLSAPYTADSYNAPPGWARRGARGSLGVLSDAAIAGAAFPLFFYGALPLYSSMQRLLAWCLFVAGILPLVRILRAPKGVPLIQLVAAQYAVQFALPVFFEDHLDTLNGPQLPDNDAITRTLICALLALASIGVGYWVARRHLHLRLRWLTFEADAKRLFVCGVVLCVGALALNTAAAFVGSGFERPLYAVFSLDLGLALLACMYYRKQLVPWQALVARLLVVMSVAAGLAGGMTQSAVQPIVIWMLCGWVLRRKRPILGLLFIAAAFFLLQPVKGTYRRVVWFADRPYSLSEKLSLYSDLLRDQWLNRSTGSDEMVESVKDAASDRLSLLLTTAHYIDWTPQQVDYKHGETLTYLFYTLIPRFVWPQKPTAQEANRILPIEYELQAPESAETGTMFGVGHVAEAYVNYGLFGIVPVFLLLGVLYSVPGLVLQHGRAVPTMAIYIALTANMMYIGSTIGHVFGGFLQQILVQALVLRLFTATRRTPSGSVATPAPLNGSSAIMA